MMAEKRMVPEVRFAGFEGAWERKNLGEVTDVYDGTHQTPHYTESGIMFLSVENINSLHSEKYISEEAFAREFMIYPEKGDVLMTRIGDIGTANVVESDEPRAYYVSLALLKKKTLNPYFLKESIASAAVKREIWHRTLHIAFPKKINKNEIASVPLYYPQLEHEQSQIGTFFKNLDNLIATQQRRVDKLAVVKKAMLEKMFPKDGANVPEIRFAGFSGAWEQRKFFDTIQAIIDFRGRTPKKLGMDWSETGYLALSALNVKDGYIWPEADAHFGDEALYQKWMEGNELHKGQVLFTTEAPMGNVAQVPDNKKYILSQRTIAFVVKEDLLSEDFLAVLLKTPIVSIHLSAMSSGGTAKGVSQKSLAQLDIQIPSNISEQAKIASYFRTLDHLTTLQTQKLAKLKTIKQALLAKMFV